ncbi:Retrovirus-related Pol polyprotein LINE-1 [Gossypium australe]|uniref:Retrovirus-related Pol polyprotein LINE-1 n=1 Tax=Gossypium australe TaxID=47621 RepID=A0A5B6WWK3_9ROSI|nr:Retrovirus-related Pol polyprotein LINE-1 [Gossypium australe]
MVYSLKIGGRWYKEPTEMKEGLYNFFNNYFDCPARRWKMDLDLNFRMLNEERALKLEEPFSLKKIKEAVWSCDKSKAPSPDGFNLNCWETVKMDLFGLMSDFFHIGKLEKSINSSFITLIPKDKNPNEILDFRPICLVSSLYKMVSKVLSRRLREIVGMVVSDTQCAFIRCTYIFYGVLIANKLIHSSRRKGEVGWDFLELVLFKMGFGVKWRGWMMECTSMVRARPSSERSTIPIFIYFSYGALDKVVELGIIEGFQNVIPGIIFSHLQFEDDTSLFLRAIDNRVSNAKYILRCFEIFSGFSINFKKSCLVGFDVKEEILFRMAAICKCKIGANPKRITTWELIVDRFRKKLSGWKSHTFSWARKVVLINVTVIKKIDKFRWNFLWGNMEGKKKMAKVSWNIVCKPKVKGGVGVVNLKVKNKALLAKWS